MINKIITKKNQLTDIPKILKETLKEQLKEKLNEELKYIF
jgi:predicted house-cleaning noncanonical NTP pyrophosphatase (MazG superfamily)